MIEKQKHVDAFNYYFSLINKGYIPSQAIEATAEHCKMKKRTIWKWHKEFDWKAKTKVRNIEIQKEVEKEQNRTLAQNKANYLNICHKLLDEEIKEQFQNSKVKSTKDALEVIKLALLLQNAPTEVTKNSNINVDLSVEEFDEDLIDQILEEELEAEAALKEELVKKYRIKSVRASQKESESINDLEEDEIIE
ncbi:MAG: hypothetical protein IJH63_00285 [Methanobrevibacter sp.]|nr:hypothetical protein [Methanosphaera sp.]MBR0369141.1 hypothetical protein [Methanobrevibacter sp.]